MYNVKFPQLHNRCASMKFPVLRRPRFSERTGAYPNWSSRPQAIAREERHRARHRFITITGRRVPFYLSITSWSSHPPRCLSSDTIRRTICSRHGSTPQGFFASLATNAISSRVLGKNGEFCIQAFGYGAKHAVR